MSAPAPPDQHGADDTVYAFVRNVVVAASAGTGKTHRLTTLYVLSLLGLPSRGTGDRAIAAPPVAPRQVVATTFSRAAAREIQSRVESAMSALARGDGPELSASPVGRAVLARAHEVGVADEEIPRRARAALSGMHAARIDTLHATAARLVRRHAVELGVAPGVRMLDEDELRGLTRRAVDDELREALSGGGERESAARALIAACANVDRVRDEVGRVLARLDEDGLDPESLALDDHVGHARALHADIERVARAAAEAETPALRDKARLLQSALVADGGGPALGSDGARALFELAAVRKAKKERMNAGDEALASWLEQLSGSTKTEKIRAVVTYLERAPELARREALLCDLVARVHRRLQGLQARAGGLGFGEVLRVAADGLRRDPALARAVREDVAVLLVDEFQDTSLVQRELVYALRERPDSGRAPGDPIAPTHLEPSGLFLVGDRKQSIYGFRGADVAVFTRLCVELAGEAAVRALMLGPTTPDDDRPPIADFVALRENRRSAPAILDFVNTFSRLDFDRGDAEARSAFEIAYADAERLVPAEDMGQRPGDVVWIADDGSTPHDAPALVREASGAMREALLAAAYIAGIAQEADTSFRDVAVLARRRSTIPLVELALTRLGLPFVVAGRDLYASSEVRDVAALIRWLVDPRDRHALGTVVRGPAVSLTDAGLLALCTPGGGLSVDLFSRDEVARAGASSSSLGEHDEAALRRFLRRADDVRPALLRLPVDDALRAVVAGFDLDEVIAALPRGPARLANLDRLVEIAQRRGGTLAGFSRWLQAQILDDTDEPEAVVFSSEDDAVRLTTIHGSKGLDFPVVVLLDLDAAPAGTLGPIGVAPAEGDAPATFVCRHVDRTDEGAAVAIVTDAMKRARLDRRARDVAERKRLTYVALTRAARRLVLVQPSGQPKRGSAFATLDTERLGDAAGAATDLAACVTRVDRAHDLLATGEALRTAEASQTGEACGATDGGDDQPRPAHASLDSARPLDLPPASRSVTLATTPLAMFQGCARRFRFRYLLGLEEPLESGQLDLFEAPSPPDDERRETGADPDPREAGRAAHRVLETWPLELWGEETPVDEVRASLLAEGLLDGPSTEELAQGLARFLEGSYAKTVRRERAVVLREWSFVSSFAPEAGVTLALRGAMDLLVRFGDGRIEVVDYKHARPGADLSRYEFQLRAYALVARRSVPDARVKAGLLVLGADDAPRMLAGRGKGGHLADEEHDAFERELGALGARFSHSRDTGSFEGQPLARCRRLGCGFVTACHRRGP